MDNAASTCKVRTCGWEANRSSTYTAHRGNAWSLRSWADSGREGPYLGQSCTGRSADRSPGVGYRARDLQRLGQGDEGFLLRGRQPLVGQVHEAFLGELELHRVRRAGHRPGSGRRRQCARRSTATDAHARCRQRPSHRPPACRPGERLALAVNGAVRAGIRGRASAGRSRFSSNRARGPWPGSSSTRSPGATRESEAAVAISCRLGVMAPSAVALGLPSRRTRADPERRGRRRQQASPSSWS